MLNTITSSHRNHAGQVPNPQKCIVNHRTGNDVLRSTEVTATSVYEAACLALRAFTDDPLQHHPNQEIHPAYDFVIDVQPVAVQHRVRVAALVSYLNGLGKPRDAGEKHRLRQIVKDCGLGIVP